MCRNQKVCFTLCDHTTEIEHIEWRLNIGGLLEGVLVVHCKWKKMDDMKVMFVFIRVMLVDESYVPVNESYHYKMAFGLCAWKQT